MNYRILYKYAYTEQLKSECCFSVVIANQSPSRRSRLLVLHGRALVNTSMRDRFKILLRLTHYSDEEMRLLLSQRAKRLGWEIDEACLCELAKRSRGVPRLGVRLLDAAKRICVSERYRRNLARAYSPDDRNRSVDDLGSIPLSNAILLC